MINRLIKQKLRLWLEIRDPVESKDWTEEIASVCIGLGDVRKVLEEYKTAIGRFSEIQCSNCHKTIKTYPLGGGYYREADGRILCSGVCLDQKQAK